MTTDEISNICPVCNHKVEESDTAVLCDEFCQAWHHQIFAELQLSQFNALKTTNKRKSKLFWFCEICEKDFRLYKAGKGLKKDIEEMRAEMNTRLNKITQIIKELRKPMQLEKGNTQSPIIQHFVTVSPSKINIEKEKNQNESQASKPNEKNE